MKKLDRIDTYGLSSEISEYFDYERFGRDIAEGNEFVELPDGRFVELNY